MEEEFVDETREGLETVIREYEAKIKDMAIGSEERSRAVEDLKKLYSLRNDETKIEADLAKATMARESNEKIEQAKLDDQKDARKLPWWQKALGIGLDVAKVAVPAAIGVFGLIYTTKNDNQKYYDGLKVEQGESLTMTTFREERQKQSKHSDKYIK